MAYVIQLSNGQVRLYESEDAALAHEKRLPENVGIVGGCEVDGGAHYHGKIPAKGVLFTKEDQSFSQLLGAMAYEA